MARYAPFPSSFSSMAKSSAGNCASCRCSGHVDDEAFTLDLASLELHAAFREPWRGGSARSHEQERHKSHGGVGTLGARYPLYQYKSNKTTGSTPAH
jgi:hypothetical protein